MEEGGEFGLVEGAVGAHAAANVQRERRSDLLVNLTCTYISLAYEVGPHKFLSNWSDVRRCLTFASIMQTQIIIFFSFLLTYRKQCSAASLLEPSGAPCNAGRGEGAAKQYDGGVYSAILARQASRVR